jgi:hypothetical protein
MAEPVVSLGGPSEEAEKRRAIGVRPIDGLALIAAGSEMVHRTGVFDP